MRFVVRQRMREDLTVVDLPVQIHDVMDVADLPGKTLFIAHQRAADGIGRP